MPASHRYDRIIERIFFVHYEQGADEVVWDRGDIEDAARALRVSRPKNFGDVVYTYRFRRALPASVQSKAPAGREWIIRGAGHGRYKFIAARRAWITPNPQLSVTKVPDATPGVIERYALSDEQALLAKLRYNRLIDVFTGVTCYSLQSHLRTAVQDLGQVETDEIYVGLDRRGAHYVFPVQAKGEGEKLGVVQIEQDLGMCAEKFPSLICRPIGAQFIEEDLIALFELEIQSDEIRVSSEKRYRLVPADGVTSDELAEYRRRAD